jgi:hypothetical protein
VLTATFVDCTVATSSVVIWPYAILEAEAPDPAFTTIRAAIKVDIISQVSYLIQCQRTSLATGQS